MLGRCRPRSPPRSRRSTSATTPRRRGVVGRILVLRLRPRRRLAGRLRPPGPVPGQGLGLVLGHGGGRGAAPGHRRRPRGRPAREGSLEVRAEGLWADHTVEVPFDHVTLGCEAFALGTDDPAEVYGGRGDRVLPRARPRSGRRRARCTPTRRHHPLRDPLPGARRRAGGRRAHRGGRHRPARPLVGPAGLVGPGPDLDGRRPGGRTRFHGTAARLGDVAVPYHPGYIQARAGRWWLRATPRRPRCWASTASRPRPPSSWATCASPSSRWRSPRSCWTTRPAGSAASRALCRFTDVPSGRRGVGWTGEPTAAAMSPGRVVGL